MRILSVLAVLGVMILAGALFFLSSQIYAPGPLATEKNIYIKPGSSVKKIALQLKQEDIITETWLFLTAARLQQDQGALKAGEFKIPADASINDVIQILRDGKTVQYNVTIPEGLMSVEITHLLHQEKILTGVIDKIPAEGSLLPDTYAYIRGDTRGEIINRMQMAMQKTLDELWEERAKNTPVTTKEEALVLASIVEKETGVTEERRRVAGVFANRLKINMPLQSDPTAIYAHTQGKERFSRKLWSNDLKIESPYNTYHTRGLPPGPIANPGRESIIAALNPENHNYLYFVADGTGGHVFAKTHDEHINNANTWRKIRSGK